MQTQAEQSRAFAHLKNLPSNILSLPQPFCTVSDIPVCYSSLFKWVLKAIFFENPLFKVEENTRQGCNLSARRHWLRMGGSGKFGWKGARCLKNFAGSPGTIPHPGTSGDGSRLSLPSPAFSCLPLPLLPSPARAFCPRSPTADAHAVCLRSVEGW